MHLTLHPGKTQKMVHFGAFWCMAWSQLTQFNSGWRFTDGTVVKRVGVKHH